MFQNIKLITIAALFSCTFSQAARPGCYETRHIYNNSSADWKILPTGGAQYYAQICISRSDSDDSPCEPFPFVIPASQTVTVHYSYKANHQRVTSNGIVLTDSNKFSKNFWTHHGCYIEHDGDTGGASLNDPAEGDITIDSAIW